MIDISPQQHGSVTAISSIKYNVYQCHDISDIDLTVIIYIAGNKGISYHIIYCGCSINATTPVTTGVDMDVP